jgi:hypothetical protein
MPAAGFVFTGIIAVVSGDANSNLEKGMPVVKWNDGMVE